MSVRPAVRTANDQPLTADELVSGLVDRSAGLHACALIDPAGRLLAASAAGDWTAQADRLWAAVEDPSRPAAAYVHVAIDGGELFAVRSGHGSVIAITDRFALSSLMLCDLRAALRRLAPAAA